MALSRSRPTPPTSGCLGSATTSPSNRVERRAWKPAGKSSAGLGAGSRGDDPPRVALQKVSKCVALVRFRHDDLQQWLFGIKLRLESVTDALWVLDRPELSKALQEVLHWIGNAIASTRGLSVDLVPAVLEVSDKGDGFDLEQAGRSRSRRTGLGLFSVRERIRMSGGNVEIDTAPGQGTRILISPPLSFRSLSQDPHAEVAS